MTPTANTMLLYLDQNVFSRLQEGAVGRTAVLGLLGKAAESGALVVYSIVHVEECRISENPRAFVEILEVNCAHFLEPSSPTDASVNLSRDRAEELILCEPDISDAVARSMNQLLKPLHFAMGWLGNTEAGEILDEITEGLVSFWSIFEMQFPSGFELLSAAGKAETLQVVRSLRLQSLAKDGRQAMARLRERLPRNYAQLDEIPSEMVAEYLLSCLPEDESAHIKTRYSPGFWSEVANRKDGDLAGFAFLLFAMGLVRDPRVKKKERWRRDQHFLGQFRDCQHIETAARCDIFITFDRGAARLASAVYAYAGVRTEVLLLEELES